MIPSRTWFPMSLAERAAWMQNFTTQLALLGPSLGIGPTDISQMQDDNTAFQFLASTSITVDNYDKAFTAYRKAVTEGPLAGPLLEIPAPPVYPAVLPTINQGLFERLDSLVKRIRVAPNYSIEDGQTLGIVPAVSPTPEPETMQPTLKLSAMPGNIVMVDFVRGKTDGIEVQMQLDLSETWENAGKYFKAPAEILIPNGAAATPRGVKMRARYVQGNTVIGQYSDIAQISSIP